MARGGYAAPVEAQLADAAQTRNAPPTPQPQNGYVPPPPGQMSRLERDREAARKLVFERITQQVAPGSTYRQAPAAAAQPPSTPPTPPTTSPQQAYGQLQQACGQQQPPPPPPYEQQRYGQMPRGQKLADQLKSSTGMQPQYASPQSTSPQSPQPVPRAGYARATGCRRAWSTQDAASVTQPKRQDPAVAIFLDVGPQPQIRRGEAARLVRRKRLLKHLSLAARAKDPSCFIGSRGHSLRTHRISMIVAL